MDYKQVILSTTTLDLSDILVALLSEEGYDGFEEKDNTLIAYIPISSYQADVLNSIVERFPVHCSVSDIARVNWNKSWEANFEPVIVDDFCTVRAHFHELEVTTAHEIIITPKMSFGTGHHATTQLMMKMMRKIDFHNRSVLDFGAGTGILSILSAKLGAREIVGIDNEEWAVENATENVVRNEVQNVKIHLGSIEMVRDIQFDIILANINRHILLQYMNVFYNSSKPGTDLLLSGLLIDDRQVIVTAALEAGFRLMDEVVRSDWIILWFQRQD